MKRSQVKDKTSYWDKSEMRERVFRNLVRGKEG